MVKNCEKTITKCYEIICHFQRQHHNITQICFADLKSKDLTITLLTLLINRDKNIKIMVIRHKKSVTLGQAIMNAHKICASNCIVILDAKENIQLRKISKEIKLLHKAHIILPHKKDTLNMAYRKEFVKFKPDNQIRKQLLKIAKNKHLRISKIE